MDATQNGRVRERKRSAKSPLESSTTRRRLDQDMGEDLFSDSMLSNTNKTEKIKDQLRSSGRERRHDGSRDTDNINKEAHMRGMVASLNNLEQLYSKLDVKVKKNQVEVGRRLQKISSETNAKLDRLEQIQLEVDRRADDFRAQIDTQNTKIELLEAEIKNAGTERLKEVISNLEKRQEELEEKTSQQEDVRGPNMDSYRDLLVGLAKSGSAHKCYLKKC